MKNIQKHLFVKIIGIFLFAFLVVIYAHGQSYQQSLLLNKEWTLRLPGKTFYSTHIFTDKESIVKTFINDGDKTDIGLKEPYYLSDKVVEKFEPNLVGKSKCGKYIVRKTNNEDLELYEILELTETNLKTKHLRSGSVLEYKVE